MLRGLIQPVHGNRFAIRLMSEVSTPLTVRKDAQAADAVAWHGHVSLRVKGLLSLLAFIFYIGAAGVLILSERSRLFEIVQGLEQVHLQESQLVQVNLLVARAVLSANEHYFAAVPEVAARQIQTDLMPLERLVAALLPGRPQLGLHVQRMQAIRSELAVLPSRSGIAKVRAELHRLVLDIESYTRDVRGAKERLLGEYRNTHDKVTLETLSLALLGVVIFGALVTIFFTRLTWDIRRVSARAIAIIKGYRGEPLDVTRGDDVGGLMLAVNEMQRELRVRERHLEFARQQQFHHDKMVAVGSLASAVAHEINNPIMAIAGVAEAMVENKKRSPACCACDADCQPELILEQTRRIARITRQISEFTVPQSPEPRLLDLNALISSTVSFVRFDKRFGKIDLALVLDSQLPAVEAVADHLTQVFINLLVNAADALEDVSERTPQVRVTTSHDAHHAIVEVSDNGIGMSEAVRQQAFEEYFTTKGPGKGSGIGLFLCKSLLEESRGKIELDSQPGKGTQVIVRLPLASGPE